jgi:LPS sulfotransferase NodH
MSQYLCIVAGQRAGTTAFQGALGSTGKFCNFREIFHTEPSVTLGSFLEFSRQRNLCIADMASETQTRKVALEYLAYLQDIAKQQLPLLDVKLNSWHVIKPFWSYVHQMPFFMNLLLKNGALFLFIRRRDIVEQVLSEQIARSADKWHGLEDGDILGQIEVNSAIVASQARLIRQSETFLLGCLGASNRLIAIDYEDLYPDGLVNSRLLLALQDKLGIDLPSILHPPIKKNVPDKRRIVANYDEASQAITGILSRFPRAKVASQITE